MLFNHVIKNSSIALLLVGTVSCGQIHLTEDPFSATDATKVGAGKLPQPKIIDQDGKGIATNGTESDTTLNGNGDGSNSNGSGSNPADGQSCEAPDELSADFAYACDVFVEDKTPEIAEIMSEFGKNDRYQWLARGFCIDSSTELDANRNHVFEGNIGNRLALSVNATYDGAETNMRFGLYKVVPDSTNFGATSQIPLFTDGSERSDVKIFSANSCANTQDQTYEIEVKETKNNYRVRIACTIEQGTCGGKFTYNYLSGSETPPATPAEDGTNVGEITSPDLGFGDIDDDGDRVSTPDYTVNCTGKSTQGKDVSVMAEIGKYERILKNNKVQSLSDISVMTDSKDMLTYYKEEFKHDQRSGLGWSGHTYLTKLGTDRVVYGTKDDSYLKIWTKNHKTGTAKLSGKTVADLTCEFIPNKK